MVYDLALAEALQVNDTLKQLIQKVHMHNCLYTYVCVCTVCVCVYVYNVCVVYACLY